MDRRTGTQHLELAQLSDFELEFEGQPMDVYGSHVWSTAKVDPLSDDVGQLLKKLQSRVS